MIVRPAADALGVVGVRIDWLASAFRVRFPQEACELLDERAKKAKKHGTAPIDFAGDLWEMAGRRTGPAIWLLSEARSERLELAMGAPGSYVTEDGEVIPGWTLAVHASSNKLVLTGTRRALERGWLLAKKAGIVFEGRARRLDLTGDVRGVLLGQVDEEGWKALAHVGTTDDNGEEICDDDERSSGVLPVLGHKRLSPAHAERAEQGGIPQEGEGALRGRRKRAQLYLLPK